MPTHLEECINDRNRWLLLGFLALLVAAPTIVAIDELQELVTTNPFISGGVMVVVGVGYLLWLSKLQVDVNQAYTHRIVPGQPYY